VTVKAPSTAPTGIAVTDDNTCQGTAKALTVQGGSLGDGANWHWYSDAGFTTPEGTGASIAVDPAVSTTYYVRAEGDCNTTTAASALVTVRTESTAPAGYPCTNDNTCQGTGKTLTVQGGSLGDGANWHWYSDAGFTTPEGTGVSIMVDPAVNTIYYVRAEGDCNITASINQMVTVKTLSTGPTGISVTENHTCYGIAKTLTVLGGSLGDGADWFWSDDPSFDTIIGTGVSIVVDPLLSTTYYVRAGGDCNITDYTGQLVSVKTESYAPDSIAVSGDSTCPGTPIVLTVIGGSLGEDAFWNWTVDPASFVSIDTGWTITVNPAITTTYFVRAEGGCNNTEMISRSVHVLTLSTEPDSISVLNDNTCPGTLKILEVQGGSLSDLAIWNWSTDSTFAVSIATGDSIAVDPAITTTYFVRAEGVCDTTRHVSRTVLVKEPSTAPDTAMVDHIEFCFGTVDTITLSFAGGYAGTGALAVWYDDPAMSGIPVASGNNVMIPSPGDTTTYYVRFEGDCDTTGAANVTVIVNPLPEPSVSGQMLLCVPVEESYSASGFEGSSFRWTVTGGTFTGSDTGEIVSIQWTGEGAGSVAVTETTISGCATQADSAVVKYPTPPHLTIGGTGDVVCSGDTGILYYVDSRPGSILEWTVAGGIVSRESGDTIYVDWIVPAGIYSVSVRESSAEGCAGIPVTMQVVAGGPVIDLGEDTYICDGETFEAMADPGYDSYLWHDGSSGLDFSTGEEGWISLQVTDTLGCTTSDSIYLTVRELPGTDLGEDRPLCGDEGLILDAGPDGASYRWSTGENSQTITVSQGQRQVITVMVTDIYGCESGDTVVIDECNPEFYFRDIPTAITPNDDGVNDVWNLEKLSTYSQASVEIFDRWGTLVWRSEPGYSQPWDGRNMRGDLVPMDSYHFVIRLNTGSLDQITGVVTVIR
jgi:gliding motility-associated-like protein